ncbi:uncharacterized protein LOC129730052 isoform X1 [Wyeomyia smithii]|uniref:uncharacterized protein LOC129730052 isoform X1 n=1 Tax=Wyeomyia smithii TaxID=174621 RepID=UPI0024681352|nr:uncharacterized protein LOC129730052 isoform X1 [Wyeomyia smithii]
MDYDAVEVIQFYQKMIVSVDVSDYLRQQKNDQRKKVIFRIGVNFRTESDETDIDTVTVLSKPDKNRQLSSIPLIVVPADKEISLIYKRPKQQNKPIHVTLKHRALKKMKNIIGKTFIRPPCVVLG